MDIIQKGLLLNRSVAIFAINSTELVQKAVRTHKLSPVAAAALGRTMTAAALMASELKNETDSLSVTIKGDGPLGNIVVSADSALNVRGLVGAPDLMIPLKPNGKLDVGGAVGAGTMTVIKDVGLKEPYVSQVKLVSGEIAEDFAQYFSESEQQETAVSLGVLTDKGKCVSAGGVLIRILPFCSAEHLSRVEQKLAALSDISGKMRGKDPKEYLEEYFSDMDLELTERAEPRYKCKCSRRMLRGVLASLPPAELFRMLVNDGKVTVECHYCNKKYEFFPSDFIRQEKPRKSRLTPEKED